jgi:hypothetical protein
MLFAKRLNGGGGKVPGVSSTQNIGFTIRGRVQDRIAGRIGQGNRLDYDWFNEVSGIRQIALKARLRWFFQ